MPGRDAERLCRLGHGRAHASRAARAQSSTDGPERRHLGQHGDAPRRGVEAVRRGSAEVGRLHRARTATGGDHVAWRRARGRGGRRRRTPASPRSGGVAAHHADQVLRPARYQPRRAPRRSRGRAAPAPARRRRSRASGTRRRRGRPANARTASRFEARQLAPRLNAVELIGGVEPRSIDVDRRDAQRRQHQRTRASRRAPRRRARTCNPGTSRRPLRSRASSPDRSVRSTWRTRQPESRVAPTAIRRSKSSSDSTSTTRPRLRLTSAT